MKIDKDNELGNLILAGGVYLVAEYRGSKIETIKYVSKKTGLAAEFSRRQYLLEYGDSSSMTLSEGIDDVATAGSCKLVRGKLYLFAVESLQEERGVRQGRIARGSQPVEVSY